MKSVSAAVCDSDSDTQRGRYLTFLLDKEVFGIEINYVTEIIGIQRICPLPESPDYVKGVINLRGNIIPVIDMRLRFKKEPAAYTERTCIIVINLLQNSIGLIVDCVNEVILLSDRDIVPPPDFKTGYESQYIKGIGKTGEDIRLLLDCEQLFRCAEFSLVDQIKN